MARKRNGRFAKTPQQKQAQPAQSHAADHEGSLSSGPFHRFQDLPAELRLMVWKAALAPRLVAVKPRPCPKKNNKASDLEISLLRGTPALLAVNQESRYLALRHFTWRFTIDLLIRPDRRYYAGPWGVSRRRARVVMAPEDTLGLFLCDPSCFASFRAYDFRVKVADDKKSPWRVHPSTSAPGGDDWFKKVAVLGDTVAADLEIVRALNATPWDLDSLLHGRSAVARTARSPHTEDNIFIASAEMEQLLSSAPVTGLSAIESTQSARLKLEGRKDPDVAAYELAGGQHGRGWHHFLKMLSDRAVRPHAQRAVRYPRLGGHYMTTTN